jgi:hypothetical protein
MQPNKTKIALLLGAVCLGASGAANAATADFDITVTTIPDVTLTEVQALDFGTTMYVTAGGNCLMNAATPGNAVAGQMQYTRQAGSVVAATNYGDLTGTGCVNGTGNGTPGIYRISGIPGGSVRITISGVTGADFSFAPNSGCIVNYSGDDTDDGDECSTFVPGVQTTRLLAATTEDDSTAPAGQPSVPGQLMFTVGGTVTIGGVDLTPNQAYTENFPVTVIY